MKKKVLLSILCLMITLCFIACLTACNKDDKNPSSNPPTNSQTDASTNSSNNSGGNSSNTSITPQPPTPETQGLKYSLNPDEKSYSVTGIGTVTDTNIVIPKTYNNLPVTSIGYEAFRDCSSLTSVTIPNSVNAIGERAFDGCSKLQYNVYENAKYLGNSDNPYLVLVTANNKSITSCEINSNTNDIFSWASFIPA